MATQARLTLLYDDGLSGFLSHVWTHVGGTGPGPLVFGDPNALVTTAAVPSTPGSYVMRLSVDDGEFVSFDDDEF